MAKQAQQFALVHGWDGALIPVRITDIDGVCMFCGSTDGEPCAKADRFGHGQATGRGHGCQIGNQTQRKGAPP